MILLSIAGWICLFALCENKFIEVNNEGNESSSCCTEGTCLCSSLFKAFLHVENNTVINITSSVSLHNLSRIGSETLLNNVTITGNRITVACNNSGSFACVYCHNVVIQGITWDQCGDPNNPNISHAVGFGVAINVSILGCTFQHSKGCFALLIPLSSGFVEIHDNKFLFNHATNFTLCYKRLHGSLAIISGNHDVRQNVSVSINETLFYQNGVPTDSTLICFLFTEQVVKFHIENTIVSTSVGLGGNFMFDDISSNVIMQLTNVTFYNNSNGGSIIRIVGHLVSILADSCSYAHNINGLLKLEISGIISYIILYKLTVIGNKETFMDDDPAANSNNINQGSGILISSSCMYSSINISYCNIQDNSGGKSIVFMEHNLLLNAPMVSIVSSNFTNNVGSTLYLSGYTVQFGGHVLFMNNSADRGAAMYLDQGSQIAIKESSTIIFIKNAVSQEGGAIFIEMSFGCPESGNVFTNLADSSTVAFINNSAKNAGNYLF